MTTSNGEPPQHTFIILISNKGIECYAEVSSRLEQFDSYKKELSWAILKGSKQPEYPDLPLLKKMFTLIYGKHIEQPQLYVFTTTFDENTVRMLVNTNPNALIESVKQFGTYLNSQINYER